MESAAENSRSVDRRTPAERTQPRSWVSRIALVGSLFLLAYFVWSLPAQFGLLQLARAETLANEKKFDEALAMLDSARSYLPKVPPGLYITKAKIYAEMGNKKAAEENLTLATPLLTDSYRELLVFANLAAELKLPEAVVQVCDKIDTAASKHEMEIHRQLLNTSAYCRAVVNRDCDKGLKAADKALSFPNGMPSLTVSGQERAMFEDTRALLLHRLGRNEEALVDINSAIAYQEKAYEREFGKPMPAPGAAEPPKPDSAATPTDQSAPDKNASEKDAAEVKSPEKDAQQKDAAETKAPDEKTPNEKATEKTPPETTAAEKTAPDAKAADASSKTDSASDLLKSGPYKGLSKEGLKNWAVMYNHRQMIREALGDKAGAELDRQRIVEMGQTPGEELH